ncbi:ABC transporter substrate-binding protein [Paenibacillus gansuensis]|uniref:ABC transporter substrate-binding protein n=1 Tax=Paenibacillus gansuensis TaxID=306542 RepID=A0ABW5PA16_9BACL
MKASRKFNVTQALIVILMVALVLAGCGNNAGSSNGEGNNQGNNAGASGNEAQNAEYKVKHAMGETTIKGTPKRVVVLTNEGTEALLAMGVKPVGAVKSWTGNPWYEHLKADMEGVEVLGDESQPNLEKIAELAPDLIIGTKFRQEKIYSQLEAIAPTVMSETLRGEWQNNFKLYAEALNKKAEGDKVIAEFDANVKAFKEKAGDKLNTKVSIVRFMPGKVRIYYKNTFSGMILSELGMARPAAQDKDEFSDDVSKERIPDMEGDILIYFTYEEGDNKATDLEKEWMQDPLWKNLNVVKNNKVFKVDDTTWNTSGGVISANKVIEELYGFLDIQK